MQRLIQKFADRIDSDSGYDNLKLAKDLVDLVKPSPLVWVGNESIGWAAVTSLGDMRVVKIGCKFNFYENHPDPKSFGECTFDTEKGAKERVQELHNERILAWLG